MNADPHAIHRFVEAQERMYATALAELRAGEKRSHWIWYIFPQVAGLGYSAMSHRYAIRSAAEAKAYMNHAVLGPRLVECARALLAVNGRSATQIMGDPDDLKLRSSMTLFARVSGPESIFRQVLEKYYGGAEDPKTVVFLQADASASGSHEA
jgi:uncharacterized protein (DUF1810 family)